MSKKPKLPAWQTKYTSIASAATPPPKAFGPGDRIKSLVACLFHRHFQWLRNLDWHCSWLASAVSHAALLVVLGLWMLAKDDPPSGIALQSSIADSGEYDSIEKAAVALQQLPSIENSKTPDQS